MQLGANQRQCLQKLNMVHMDKDVKSRDTTRAVLKIRDKLIELQTSIHFSPGDRTNWTLKHHICVG